MIAIGFVLFMLLAMVLIKGYNLKIKCNSYKARLAQLEKEIEAEKQRADEIEEYTKYTETKKYIEDIAKDKLGMVYENEIVFKSDD